MVFAAMAVQEQHGCVGSDPPLSGSDKISAPTCKNVQSKEQFSPGDDFAPKARKPYTITKQRERWTDEEHKKFLEALKLYGRSWRRIEEHVGTKTAVQIRSHAQKFFSKVVRESNTGDASSVKPIEIPPPRPKRKPMHPYPRKQVSPVKMGISIPEKQARSASQENQSPTSVLSAVMSDSSGGTDSCMPKFMPEDVISSVQDREDGNSSPDEQIPLELELSAQNIKEDPNESAAQSFKLFGKTFSVVDPHGSSYSTDKTKGACIFPWRIVPLNVPMSWGAFSDSSPTSIYSTERKSDLFSTRKMSDESNTCCPVSFPWLTLSNNSSCSTLEVHSPTPIKPRPSCDKKDNDEQKEGSFTGSNTDSVSALTHEGKSLEADSCHLSLKRNGKPFSSYKLSKRLSKRISADSSNCTKGFVPYKRCLAKQGSTVTTEEREKQRIRLCL